MFIKNFGHSEIAKPKRGNRDFLQEMTLNFIKYEIIYYQEVSYYFTQYMYITSVNYSHKVK